MESNPFVRPCQRPAAFCRPGPSKNWTPALFCLPRFSPLTDGRGAYLPAIAPNHFVFGLSARVAQNEFAGHVKTVRITDSHAAIKLVHNEAVVWCRVRFGHNDPDVSKGPPHRATCLPDHGVTHRLVKHPMPFR